MTKFPDTIEGRMLEAIASYGVASAKVEFDGGGDNGQIHTIEVEGLAEGVNLKALQLRPEHVDIINEISPTGFGTKSLYDLIEAGAYAALERTLMDWVNNDGGWGTVLFVPGSGIISVDINIRLDPRAMDRRAARARGFWTHTELCRLGVVRYVLNLGWGARRNLKCNLGGNNG